jgi:hypothetical protein
MAMKQPEQSLKQKDALLPAAALRMARRCRHIVQGCLREEEWADADAEFYSVILEELQQVVRESGIVQGPLRNGDSL